MARRTAIMLAVGLALGCRPPPTPPPPPTRGAPLFVLTPDRLYTDAPVGEGASLVPVREKELERRAGGVTIALRYPAIELADEEIGAELTEAIAGLVELERWTAEKGDERVGSVSIACSAGLATTTLVSVVCERLDATLSRDEARRGAAAGPVGPAIAARIFDVSGPKLRTLGRAQLFRPGVGPRELVAAALAAGELAPHERTLWEGGACAEGEPGLSLDPAGATVWPDVLTGPCPPLRIGGEALDGLLIPGGAAARALRAGEPAEG